MTEKRKTTSSNYVNQSFLQTKCALNELIQVLSKRWITEVLFSIEDGHDRFSSIKDDLGYISDHILADRLRVLETNGFIRKDALRETPARIGYAVTERGRELSALLGGLCDFAGTTVIAALYEKGQPFGLALNKSGK